MRNSFITRKGEIKIEIHPLKRMVVIRIIILASLFLISLDLASSLIASHSFRNLNSRHHASSSSSSSFRFRNRLSFVIVENNNKNNPLKNNDDAIRLFANSKQTVIIDGHDDDDDDDDDDGYEDIPVKLPDETELPIDLNELEHLTIAQLKQQLRLRGLKVSGRKRELIERLLRFTGSIPITIDEDSEDTDDDVGGGSATSTKARQFAEEQGKELVDVSDYLDPEDKGKQLKSAAVREGDDEEDDDVTSSSSTEVWGAEARIVDDYEGRRVVVDSLSRTVVEFTGSNQTMVQAYSVAARDALKPFLAGGGNATALGDENKTRTAAEERLWQIQMQREQASKRPVHFEDQAGLDEGDETGIYSNILHREFSDWGKYTQTGAQLSASEVQGVLLLSDVYGPFTDDTQALADKVAFECQPAVVMVPDLFRGNPWTGPTGGLDEEGQSYEEWRKLHTDLRVSVDIRAAAACLRERYGVSSVVVWGTCYGGGRALEAASGWLPDDNIHDVDGSIGPPPVNPMAVISWYPTRYHVKELFGKGNKGTTENLEGQKRQMAVMAVFAGNDNIPGASKDDAATLKALLEEDERVKDHMVKIFPGQDHGFAHKGIGKQQDEQEDPFERFVDEEFGGAGRVLGISGDAEVACLLSTAFMETYSRVFLPTIGPPISLDEAEEDWGKQIEMKDLSDNNKRDVRQEIEDSLDQYVEEPLGGYRIDPSDKSQEEELKKLLISMQDPNGDNGPYSIDPTTDDLTTIYGKLTASDEDFQLF